MRTIMKRINGKLVDITRDPVGKSMVDKAPIVEAPRPVESGLSEAQREAIFQEIDQMTIAKAIAAISKVTDMKLLGQIDSYARLKGTRQAADSRLQAVLKED